MDTICAPAHANILMAELAEYMRQSIQEWTKQNLWEAAFKKFEWIWSA